MISQSTIDRVYQLPLVDSLKTYVELKKKGANYTGLSPFTDEKTPSFTVNPAKQIWKCFSSGKSGKNAVSFLMEKAGLTYPEAVKQLAQDNGISIEYEDWTPEKKEEYERLQKEKKQRIQLMDWALAYFTSQDVPDIWLKKRGFNLDDVKRFQLGYSPDGNELLKSALTASYGTQILLQCGLIKNDKGHYDTFRNRIIMPVFDEFGNIVAFTGRLDDTKEDLKGPKYLHTQGFEQSAHLYGMHSAKALIKKLGKAYMVEGNPDVIRCQKLGLPGVAPCGSALSEAQVKIIKKYTDTVCIMADFDPKNDDSGQVSQIPGIDAMNRNAKMLLKHDIHVKCLIPGRNE